jgi:hypothetical protein
MHGTVDSGRTDKGGWEVSTVGRERYAYLFWWDGGGGELKILRLVLIPSLRVWQGKAAPPKHEIDVRGIHPRGDLRSWSDVTSYSARILPHPPRRVERVWERVVVTTALARVDPESEFAVIVGG